MTFSRCPILSLSLFRPLAFAVIINHKTFSLQLRFPPLFSLYVYQEPFHFPSIPLRRNLCVWGREGEEEKCGRGGGGRSKERAPPRERGGEQYLEWDSPILKEQCSNYQRTEERSS